MKIIILFSILFVNFDRIISNSDSQRNLFEPIRITISNDSFLFKRNISLTHLSKKRILANLGIVSSHHFTKLTLKIFIYKEHSRYQFYYKLIDNDTVLLAEGHKRIFGGSSLIDSDSSFNQISDKDFIWIFVEAIPEKYSKRYEGKVAVYEHLFCEDHIEEIFKNTNGIIIEKYISYPANEFRNFSDTLYKFTEEGIIDFMRIRLCDKVINIQYSNCK